MHYCGGFDVLAPRTGLGDGFQSSEEGADWRREDVYVPCWAEEGEYGSYGVVGRVGDEGGKFYKMAIGLVQRMLALDPEKRPKAEEVSFELGRAALVAYNSSWGELFAKMLDITDSVEADMERRRFKIWSGMFESTLEAQDCPYRTSDDPMAMLDPVLRCLANCKDEISSILDRYATALSPPYSSLRSHIDQLHDFLPGDLSKLASSQLEVELAPSSDAAILECMSQQYAAHSAAERVCMLLTIKRMSILVF